MNSSSVTGWKCRGLAIAFCILLGACADKNSDPSRPASSSHKGIESFSSGSGYKQDANGQWVPNSDKRSSFDDHKESPYSRGKIDKKEYNTGDYAEKKSWWGSKDYKTDEYGGKTGESRFQGTKARQDGMTARDDGKGARESGTFKTNANRLDGKTARESGESSIDRPLDAAVQSRRETYMAPSVTDWREQRAMSVEQSKGILGR